MSTPVSIEPPSSSRLRSDSEQERDLQARMQHMIDLQYQQQAIPSHQQWSPPLLLTTSAKNTDDRSSRKHARTESQHNRTQSAGGNTVRTKGGIDNHSGPDTAVEAEKQFQASTQTPNPSFRESEPSASERRAIDFPHLETIEPAINIPISPRNDSPVVDNRNSNAAEPIDSVGTGIGRGTLYIPKEYDSQFIAGRPGANYHYRSDSQSSALSTQSPVYTHHKTPASSLVWSHSEGNDDSTNQIESSSPTETKSQPPPTYGAVMDNAPDNLTTLDQQQIRLEQQQQQQGHEQQQQQRLLPQAYGGNSNYDTYYHDPNMQYVDEVPVVNHYNEDFMHRLHSRQGSPRDSFWQCCASFLCGAALCQIHIEHFQRSFCFGAIDGLLTGSGIVGACSGLGIIGLSARYETRLLVLALSLSSCMADAICMAFGHVWNSYVVSSGHAIERQKARRQLDRNPTSAKAELIDMLLARGVLRIDAMSLADTLVGYPDLFVDAVVGDALLTPARPDEDEDTDPAIDSAGHQHDDVQPVSEASPLVGGDPGAISGGTRRNGSTVFGWRIPSYGQYDMEEQDPEMYNANMVYEESRFEAMFMMVGFASFAALPSLMWLVLPIWVGTDPSLPAWERAARDSNDAVSLQSLIVTLSVIVMWCLGMWKSKYVDSQNWLLFGVQTVVVLLVCVASSFAMGRLCRMLLGDSLASSLSSP